MQQLDKHFNKYILLIVSNTVYQIIGLNACFKITFNETKHENKKTDDKRDRVNIRICMTDFISFKLSTVIVCFVHIIVCK